MEITVNNVQQTLELPQGCERLMEECVSLACQQEGFVQNYAVGIIIMDDAGIRELNRDYRGVDAPTDVLSFAFLEQLEEEPEIIQDGGEEILLLGDIVVSAEAVERQAEEYGHSVIRELCFLVVHGIFHLLGYDHQTPEADQLMVAKQKKVLDDLNISR